MLLSSCILCGACEWALAAFLSTVFSSFKIIPQNIVAVCRQYVFLSILNLWHFYPDLVANREVIMTYLLVCLSVRVRCTGCCGVCASEVQTVVVTEILPKQKSLPRLLPRQTVTVIVKLKRFPPANKPISWTTSAHKTQQTQMWKRKEREKRHKEKKRKEKSTDPQSKRFQTKDYIHKGRIK